MFRGLYIVTFVRIGAVDHGHQLAGRLVIAGTTTIVKTIGLVRDALAGKVAMCEGRVYSSHEAGQGSPWDALREQWTRVRQERPKTCRYAIRDVTPEVSYEGFQATRERRPLQGYYTPLSELLLSIEPAGGAAPARDLPASSASS